MIITTHEGIEFTQIRRYGTDCFVHIIDLTKVVLKIRNGFMSVTDAVSISGAQLGFNAGGWGLWKNKSLPNEYLIIEGRVVSAQSYDLRPCLHISKAGNLEFLNRPNFSTSWNVVGFDRIIAAGGVYNTRINDNASNPRTIYGKDVTGRLVILVCDGRLPEQKGLTFKEGWEVMKEFDVTDCGNADGGYSSAAVNTALAPALLNKSYLGEVPPRRVVYQVLINAKKTGNTSPPPLPPEPPKQVVKIIDATVRYEVDGVMHTQVLK